MLTTSVGSKSTKSTLTGAILLYANTERQSYNTSFSSESTTFATVHSVASHAGRPEILPGRPITEKDLVAIHQGLSTENSSKSIVWLDQQILAKGPDRMVWWTPPMMRSMFFKSSSHVKSTFDGSAVCPTPTLVWLAIHGKGLYVYATSEPGRPTASTELFQAPFFNVWSQGLVCSGNAQQPSEENIWNPADWEKFFFGSNFTHPNFGEKDRLIKGQNPCNFWQAMVKKPLESFPVKKLVKVPLIANDLIDPLILDRLNKFSPARGEF